MKRDHDYERRKQRRLQSLGCDHPQCAVCGENRWECLELHHVEGQAFGSTLVVLCRNCHRQASDLQLAHPSHQLARDRDLTRMARLLSGFADLLEMVVEKLRETSRVLLGSVDVAEA